MSEVANANNPDIVTSVQKPVQDDDVKFPPFPEPTSDDFEDDIGDDERTFYKEKFTDLNTINSMKLHCTACDRHLGSSTVKESRMRAHPMLRTLVCHTCHTFYNSGEFEKGDDGSELYCRWCGQGGQVYCCSDCPHVFCAKCIKRNLGNPKIKEIENTDDWKCFKCNPRCLWDLRALCWALLRYCDLKNKITYKTEDPKLKQAYEKDCSTDHTECCKNKQRRREKSDVKSVKKESEPVKKANTAAAITSRIPPTIQVKKFASINVDDLPKEKKAPKRPLSPSKSKPFVLKNPVPISQCQNVMGSLNMPPLKKIRMPVMPAPVRFPQEKRPYTYPNAAAFPRIRPKPPTMAIPIMPTQFNGFANNTFSSNPYNNMAVSDNINLSLESLTQGLDMAAVVAMSKNSNNLDDDVVCTPDFPLEPLCEVTEDNTDDDIQCITPAPPVKPTSNSSSLMPRVTSTLTDLPTDNIIQMTEEDVTVNTVTGGLKFRVDPQTLSSNKMYRLPDGRIFAINANPSMPGGYSATIVAVTETAGKPVVPKGATYAAKLSAITSAQTSTPKPTSNLNNHKGGASKTNILRKSLTTLNKSNSSVREPDMHTSVEWYRFNLIEAIDCLEYSLARLRKLKKQATTTYLRQRSADEMRNLHRNLERVLNTSSTRFNEIRDNLNKELKQFLLNKTGDTVSDDDDDVEILPDVNEDPIYIDENSLDSTTNECNENREVDLTGVGSSDHNDSVEKTDSNNINNIEENKDNSNSNNVTAISTANDAINGDDISTSSKTEMNQNNLTENSDKLVDSNSNDNNTEKGKETEESGPSLDNINPVQSNGQENSDNAAVAESSDNVTNNNEKNDEGQLQSDDKITDEEEKEDECNKSSKEGEMEVDGNNEQANLQKDDKDQSKKVKSKLKGDEPSKECVRKAEDSEVSEGVIENILKDDKSQDPDISEEMIENLLKDDDTVDEIDNILNNRAMDVV